jgi:hypothetical protein
MDRSRKNWRRLFQIFAACACLPVFYILAIGPVALIHTKFELKNTRLGSVLEVMYDPLLTYGKKNAGSYPVKLLAKYLEFWGVKD